MIFFFFFHGGIGAEFLVVSLKEDLKKPCKHQFFSVCAEQSDLRLKIHFFVWSFWQHNLNVKKHPVFSPLTAHCTGLCVSAPYGDITQTGVTRVTFTHRSATELDMQGTGDAVCMPNEISVPDLPFSLLWDPLITVSERLLGLPWNKVFFCCLLSRSHQGLKTPFDFSDIWIFFFEKEKIKYIINSASNPLKN